MLDIDPGIIAHAALDTTTLATCWKITWTDGTTIFRFTDHDTDITLSGDGTYVRASAFTSGQHSTQADLSVSSIDVHTWLDDVSIKDEDIYAGRWDDATVEIFMVNYEIPSQGKLPLKTGNMGNIRWQDNKAIFEISGLSKKYQHNVLKAYQYTCRATLFDSECKVVKANHLLHTTTVSSIADRSTFDVGATMVPDSLIFGTAEFTSGNMSGFEVEIVGNTASTISLELPTQLELAIADGVKLYRGCDKRISTCEQYGNAINFRGEPYQPAPESILYPARKGGTQQSSSSGSFGRIDEIEEEGGCGGYCG